MKTFITEVRTHEVTGEVLRASAMAPGIGGCWHCSCQLGAGAQCHGSAGCCSCFDAHRRQSGFNDCQLNSSLCACRWAVSYTFIYGIYGGFWRAGCSPCFVLLSGCLEVVQQQWLLKQSLCWGFFPACWNSQCNAKIFIIISLKAEEECDSDIGKWLETELSSPVLLTGMVRASV